MKIKLAIILLLTGIFFLFFSKQPAHAIVCAMYRYCEAYTEHDCNKNMDATSPYYGEFYANCSDQNYVDCNLCENDGVCGYCDHVDTSWCNYYDYDSNGFFKQCDSGQYPASDPYCAGLGPGYKFLADVGCNAPACTTGTTSCTGWSPGYGAYNTCGTVTQSRTCQHDGPFPCNTTNFTQYNTVSWNSCDSGAGYSCIGGTTCEKTMGGKVTDAETGNPIANVYVNSTHGFDTTDSSGNYRIGGFPYNTGFTFDPTNLNTPCTSGYLCSGNGPTSPNPAKITGTVGGAGDCGTNCNFTYTPGHIGGHVYIDYNHNGIKDAEDVGIANVTLTATNPNKSDTTDSNGAYDISYLNDGAHTVTITVPAGYTIVGSGSKSVTIGPNNYSTDFLITPLYNIAGVVYNDFDSGNCYNPSSHGCTDKTTNPDTVHGVGIDTPYTAGSSTVTITGNGVNQTLTQSDGTYDSTQVLRSGTYTVSFTSLPTNYHMTYPSGSIPPSFTVTVGTPGKSIACSVGTYNDATCSGWGSVSNLNFGMNNEIIWHIHPCTDVRDEIVTQNFIPPTASCGGNTQKYDIQTNSACVYPGIYASGTVTPDFGAGSANANNWIVGGATPENFSPVNPGIIRTSVSYLLTTIKNNALPTINLSTVCTTSNCYLPSNLPDGIYTYPFDVTIAGTHDAGTGTNTPGTYTFPTGKNYVFIIGDTTNNSSLTFKSKVLVPNGSTAMFTASKDMYVDPTVGESTITSTAPDMEGFYSADEDFVVQSAYVNSNRCTDTGGTRDLRFNLIGSIVAGAGNTGGTFTNQRDLCFGDLTCPVGSTGGGDNGSDSTSGSTDGDNLFLTYILNAPEVIKHKNTFWQELAP